MSLFGHKCERCGDRTKETYRDVPMCSACKQEFETRLNIKNEGARSCPVDGTLMNKEVAHVVVIDRCPQCHGIWLDEGEFERLSSDAVTAALVVGRREVPARG